MLIHDKKDESALGLIATGFTIVVMAAILGHICGTIDPAGPGPGGSHKAQEATSPRHTTEQDLKHAEGDRDSAR